ncbi:hypothetical protein VB671_09130 [Nodularia spumigena UHCC 0040]|nr:hypothetical protein [Nodularia spumigena UHCC 0040]
MNFNRKFTIYFSDDSPVIDLYTLSKCDYIVGPVSTFSEWAAFYGNKLLYHLSSDKLPECLENFQYIESPEGVCP